MTRLFVLALVLAACPEQQVDCPRMQVISPARVVVLSPCVEVADTDEERAAGLRGRELFSGESLLLDFPLAAEVCVGNEEVPVAVDLVFAGEDGLVSAVERSLPPGDAEPRCRPDTRRVLIVPAGDASEVEPGFALRGPG